MSIYRITEDNELVPATEQDWHETAAERGMVDCASAVLHRQGRVLLGRRKADAAQGAGLLEFPGGKRETGETFEDAAIRELFEETGLFGSTVRCMGFTMNVLPAPHPNLRVGWYACTDLLGHQTPKLLVHGELVWLTAEELEQAVCIPSTKAVLPAILAFMREVAGGET